MNLLKKKNLALLCINVLLVSCLLTACNEEIPVLSESEYIVSDDGVTVRDIKTGSTLEEFFTAYENYPLFVSVNGADYEVLTKEVIPIDQPMNIILSDFFVDGETLDKDLFCETNQIEKENLLEYLNTEDFLSSHKVIYRYISFDIQDGVVTNVLTDSRDFNAELSYDQDR